MQCLKFSFPSQPSSLLRNSRVSSLPIYSTKKSYFPVENRWSTFRTFALPERWETQNDCRALALLSSAHAPPCSFSPGASVHSITHILWEQVSQRSQKFKPVSSHLAAGNISKSDLTTEVWAGKGSSAAPSMYQWLRPVSSQHQLSLSPIRHCNHSTDWLCSFLITSSSKCTLAKLKEPGQDRRWPVQYQHSLCNMLHQYQLLRKAAPRSRQGIDNTDLCCSAKSISNTFPTVPNCKALLQVCLSLYHTLTVTLCICCRLTIESCSW